jgi:hypothetical protein
MWTVLVVVHEVLLEDLLEMKATEAEEAVQALSADVPHETFCEAVRT